MSPDSLRDKILPILSAIKNDKEKLSRILTFLESEILPEIENDDEIEIPEKYHGEVMDACFQFLQRPETPVAIKAFSLTTLFKLSKTYPEIKPELKLIINDRLDYETAAFKSRAKKILPKL